MKSKTKIDKQMKRKLNPELVETIKKSKKNKNWLEIASLLSAPRRRKISMNLDEIDREVKEGDTVVVAGKVLGTGNLSKKARIVALSFSEMARRKLKANKCEVANINEEIKINPSARGIKVLGKLK